MLFTPHMPAQTVFFWTHYENPLASAFALPCAVSFVNGQEKQIHLVSLVFLLDSLYDNTDHPPITVINDLLQCILQFLLAFICHL